MSIWERDEVTEQPPPGVAKGSIWESDQPAAPAAPAEPPVGQWEDIGKSAVGGLGRGVTGTIGLPGTVGGLVHKGLSAVGVPEGAIDKAATVAGMAIPPLRLFRGPDAGQVQSAVEKYTGPFHKPQTTAGEFTSTAFEFAPGMLIPGGGAGSVARNIGTRAFNTVLPAITSETAGQLTKGTPYEPYARLAAGVGGGFAGAKLITPFAPATGRYRAAVDTLEREGVPLTAGQRTGSEKLKYMESNAIDLPGTGSRPAAIQEAAKTGLDRAVTQRVYGRHLPDEVLPSAEAATAGPDALSAEYRRLTSQYPLRSNPQMQNRMTSAVDEYERLVQPHNRTPNVAATRDDIVNRLVTQQGRMAGDEYQSIRSQIGTAARNATNATEKHALKELQRSMDEAMAAGLPPAEARAWAENNRRWALQKAIEPAVAQGASTGHISPAGLAQAVKARRGQDYARRRGDLDALAQSAKMVMQPLPNSGTAARTAMQNFGLPTAKGGGLGATLGTLIFGPGVGTFGGAAVGSAIGAMTPTLAARAATSRLGQAYLGNRVLPQDARNILAQTLSQQAIADKERKLRRVIITKD